jgi:hypothetical protein
MKPGAGRVYCETSQAENVSSSVGVSIMNRAASTARPVSYFETRISFRATDASAVGAGCGH